ncbi:MAG: hypothetical protein AAF692_10145 [Pseudomonadota bacterium]
MMRLWKSMALAFGLVPAFLLAETTEPIELWGGFTTADTKAEIKAFKAKLPKKRIEILPGCVAGMGYRQKNKRLVTIIFTGQDKDADCHQRLLAQLMERPDEAEVEGTTFGSVIGNGMGGSMGTITEGTVLIWRDGAKKTKLIKTPGNGYNLIYTVREDKYLY